MKANLYIGTDKIAVCESANVSFQIQSLPKKSKDRIFMTWIECPYIYMGIKNDLHVFLDTIDETKYFYLSLQNNHKFEIGKKYHLIVSEYRGIQTITIRSYIYI